MNVDAVAEGNPDRLLPADPATRAVARELFQLVADKPIVSPHGHVPADLLDNDRAFRDPADLLVSRDHYLMRLLHAHGVPLGELGAGGADVDPRRAWHAVAERWHLFAGTATGYWLAEELRGVFGIADNLDATSADRIYDRVDALLRTEAFRPKALYTRFGIDVLATTDDPLDPLDAHRRLQNDGYRVLPTFRPDRYLDPDADGFTSSVHALLGHTDAPTTFAGYLDALTDRRQYFIRNGAVSTDHGVVQPETIALDSSEAQTLFERIVAGSASANDRRRFRAHMLFQMARMSVEDGLVMTVHAGVFRNHSTATLRRYGADTGHDIPVATEFVHGLRAILEAFGLEPELHLILFTVDETVFSREIAPLAGFYPAVYAGAPWWFLDAPDAIGRYRAATTETAGFYRGSGFIDDTRAFLSVPARHDAARRADAAFLARLVVEGRIGRTTADRVAVDLVDSIPRKAFKL